MTDKDYCMSSYLSFRYIERDDMDFFSGYKHENIQAIPDNQRILVKTADDIDRELKESFKPLRKEKLGILLSGGMDSAILASYMEGQQAYTFRFLGGEFQKEELARAEYYAKQYGLQLHYVDIDWAKTVESNLDEIMKCKGAPVHSIEPQIFQAAIEAKKDGVEKMIIGESSDLIFGGMDGLLSKDWTLKEFKERYIFLDPASALKHPVEMDYVFERYRQDGDKIDFLKFMDDIFAIESSSSYLNAFKAAGMPYFDPYAKLKMAEKLDLKRVRNGESKYLIRELFKKKYPDFPVPEKVPMPRPVDIYFSEWEGPKRKEFLSDINMKQFSGNQKWQLYCLERFLEMAENEGKK